MLYPDNIQYFILLNISDSKIIFEFLLFSLRPKLNTKIGLHTHHPKELLDQQYLSCY